MLEDYQIARALYESFIHSDPKQISSLVFEDGTKFDESEVANIVSLLEKSFVINDPNQWQALAELYYLLSEKMAIRIIDFFATNHDGIISSKIKSMESKSSSIIAGLMDIGIIIQGESSVFLAGENMNKAIVALEILRTVAIKKDRKEIEMSLIWFYCLSIVVLLAYLVF